MASWLILCSYYTTFRVEQINMSLPFLLSLNQKEMLHEVFVALQELILYQLTFEHATDALKYII